MFHHFDINRNKALFIQASAEESLSSYFNNVTPPVFNHVNAGSYSANKKDVHV